MPSPLWWDLPPALAFTVAMFWMFSASEHGVANIRVPRIVLGYTLLVIAATHWLDVFNVWPWYVFGVRRAAHTVLAITLTVVSRRIVAFWCTARAETESLRVEHERQIESWRSTWAGV